MKLVDRMLEQDLIRQSINKYDSHKHLPTSVPYPDPFFIGFKGVSGPGSNSDSRSKKAEWSKKENKFENLMFSKRCIFSLESCRLRFELRIPSQRPELRIPLQRPKKKNRILYIGFFVINLHFITESLHHFTSSKT
jgi:hypothetical protein